MSKYLSADVFGLVIEYAVIDITIFPSDSRQFNLLLKHRRNSDTYDQLVKAKRINDVRLLGNCVGRYSLRDAILNECTDEMAKIILEHMNIIEEKSPSSYASMVPIADSILIAIVDKRRYNIMDLIHKYPYIWVRQSDKSFMHIKKDSETTGDLKYIWHIYHWHDTLHHVVLSGPRYDKYLIGDGLFESHHTQ